MCVQCARGGCQIRVPFLDYQYSTAPFFKGPPKRDLILTAQGLSCSLLPFAVLDKATRFHSKPAAGKEARVSGKQPGPRIPLKAALDVW